MKLILVSNRLPVNIVKENGEFRYTESAGGLATGMRAYVERMAGQKINAMQITWLGWAGAAIDESDQKKVRNEMVSRFQAHPFFLLRS
jgi:trehalose 6-phosphate synthase/phosphatase